MPRKAWHTSIRSRTRIDCYYTNSMLRFREVALEDAETLMRWRTQERITQYQLTDFEPDLASQRDWIADCFLRDDYYHWIFQVDGQDAGLISLANIDLLSRTTSWGYYVGEETYLGLGFLIPPYLYNWVFATGMFDSVTAEVLEGNQNAIDLHIFHGYEASPGRGRSIRREGQEITVHGFILKKTAWRAQERYNGMNRAFPTENWANGVRFHSGGTG